MAEAAYAAGPAHLAILGGPGLIPKKGIQMNNSQSSQNYFCDVKSKGIVSYLEVSIPTIRYAAFNVESPELRIYRLLVSNNLEAVFPNTVIVFRIYLSMMVSNCSGERSFSKLKLLKTRLRSCMTQERLNSLALLNIETNVLRGIDMSSLINDFALKKSRKHNIYRESTE